MHVEESGLPLRQPLHEHSVRMTVGDEIHEGARRHFRIPVGREQVVVSLGGQFFVLELSLWVSFWEETNANAILVHFVDQLFNGLVEQSCVCLGCRLLVFQFLATKEDKGALSFHTVWKEQHRSICIR